MSQIGSRAWLALGDERAFGMANRLRSPLSGNGYARQGPTLINDSAFVAKSARAILMMCCC